MNRHKKNFFFIMRNTWKRSIVGMLCMVLVGLFVALSCEKPPISGEGDGNDTIVKDKPSLTLRNTTWKLVGMVNVETDSLRVFDVNLKYNEMCLPIDEWYSLVFYNTDTILYISTSSKWSHLVYEIDYEKDTIRYLHGLFEIIQLTGDTFDGLRYYDIFRDELRKTQPFSLEEDEFRWYYNDKKNYLLYKPYEL